MKALLLSLTTILATLAMSEVRAAQIVPTGESSELVETEVMVIERPDPTKRGGSSSSVGTDALDSKTQTGWFYGRRPIKTCYNVLDSFGVPEARVKSALSLAIKTWQQYFIDKKIAGTDPELAPNTNFQVSGRCKGGEDFVVHFGTGPIFGGLQDLKAVQRLNSPAAYANKTHISQDMKWGRGYVRLVASGYYGNAEKNRFPDWKRPGSVETILTHEIGHVLGFTHTPGTVMRADLIEYAFSNEVLRPGSLVVDGERSLVSCRECARTLFLAGRSAYPQFFERLGLKQSAKVKLVKDRVSYKFADEKGETPFFETSKVEIQNAKSLLSNFPGLGNDSSISYSIYGYINPSGRKMPVVLEVNAGGPTADGFKSEAIVVRSEVDGELVEVGRFEAK